MIDGNAEPQLSSNQEYSEIAGPSVMIAVGDSMRTGEQVRKGARRQSIHPNFTVVTNYLAVKAGARGEASKKGYEITDPGTTHTILYLSVDGG